MVEWITHNLTEDLDSAKVKCAYYYLHEQEFVTKGKTPSLRQSSEIIPPHA